MYFTTLRRWRNVLLFVTLPFLQLQGQEIRFRGTAISWNIIRQATDRSEVKLEYRMGYQVPGSMSQRCNASAVANRTLLETGLQVRCFHCDDIQRSSSMKVPYYCTDFSTKRKWMTGTGTIQVHVNHSTDVILSSTGCCWADDVYHQGATYSIVAVIHMLNLQGRLNSSPRSGTVLDIKLQQHCPTEIDLRVTDADNDVVRCFMDRFINCGEVCQMTRGIFLKKEDCKLIYNGSTKIGSYGIVIRMEDFASASSKTPFSKAPLQLAVTVYNSTVSCSKRPIFASNTRQDYSEINIYTLYRDKIAVEITDQNDPLVEFITASPIGMVKSDVFKDDRYPYVYYMSVSWTPDENQRNTESFCFLGVTKHGLSTEQRCFTLNVKEVGKCWSPNPCQHFCTNTTAGFKCSCKRGYIQTNTTQCKASSECVRQGRVCDVNADCKYMNGIHRCVCKDGYHGDGTSCNACLKRITLAVAVDSTSTMKSEDVEKQKQFLLQILNQYTAQKPFLTMSVRIYYKNCPFDRLPFGTEGFWGESNITDVERRIQELRYFHLGNPFSLECAIKMASKAQEISRSTDAEKYNIVLLPSSRIMDVKAHLVNDTVVEVGKANISRLALLAFRDKLDKNKTALGLNKTTYYLYSLSDLGGIKKGINRVLCPYSPPVSSHSSMTVTPTLSSEAPSSSVEQSPLSLSSHVSPTPTVIQLTSTKVTAMASMTSLTSDTLSSVSGIVSTGLIKETCTVHKCGILSSFSMPQVASKYSLVPTSSLQTAHASSIGKTHLASVHASLISKEIQSSRETRMTRSSTAVVPSPSPFPTKLVRLVIFFTIYNMEFHPEIQVKGSSANRVLRNQIVSKLLPALTSMAQYGRLTPDLKVSFEESYKGVECIIILRALIPRNENSVSYHTTVTKLVYDLAKKEAFDSLKVVPETVQVLSKDYCLSEMTGENSSRGKFHWPLMPTGIKSILSCPYGPPGARASRRCVIGDYESASWETVKNKQCEYGKGTTHRLNILSKTKITEKNSLNTANEIHKLTKHHQNITVEDTILVSSVLEQIVNSKQIGGPIPQLLLKTANNIMKVDRMTTFAAQVENGSLSRIVRSIDRIASTLAFLMKEGQTRIEVTSNIAISAARFGQSLLTVSTVLIHSPLDEAIPFRKNDINMVNNTADEVNATVKIDLPATLLDDARRADATRNGLGVVVYKDDSLFPNAFKTRRGEYVRAASSGTNSLIISIDVGTDQSVALSNHVQMTFENRKRAEVSRKKCVFWDFQKQGNLGAWSTRGCHLVESESTAGVTSCECDHLTNFAVLLDPYAGTKVQTVPVVHRQALSIITYIGVGISIGALLFTLLTMVLFRDLREGIHTRITIQLSISLLITLLVFVAVVGRNFTGIPCRISAMAVHYLILVTFSWQLVAALNLYLSFVIIKRSNVNTFMLRATILSWGIPSIMVGLAAGGFWKYYASDNVCVVTRYAAYAFLFGPILFVILVNFVVAILVLRSLAKPKSISKNKKREGQIRLRFVFMCCSLLGLTWLFGALAIGDARIVFQYLFCIFNSLQGFFIFYFQVIRKPVVKKRWAAFLGGKGRNHPLSSYSPSNSDFSLRGKVESKKSDRQKVKPSVSEGNESPIFKPVRVEIGNINGEYSISLVSLKTDVHS